MNQSELEYWASEFPELDSDDIEEILKAIMSEDEEKPYSNFIKPKEPATVANRLKKIFDMDD